MIKTLDYAIDEMVARAHALLRFAIICTLALSAPTAAHAAPVGQSDVATDKARELHIEANTLYSQGEYARARVCLVAAWALLKHWQIPGALGDTELQLGLYRDAAEHLAYYMRESPHQPPSPEAQKLFEEARSRIGTLAITVDVPGAEVEVDGTVVGKTPLADPVFVEAGRHTIEARVGTRLTAMEVDVGVDGRRQVLLALAARPGPSIRVLATGAPIAGVAFVTAIGLMVAGRRRRACQLGQPCNLCGRIAHHGRL